MTSENDQPTHSLPSHAHDDCLSTASILSWVQNLHTNNTSSYTPHLGETDTGTIKRCRSLTSTPSDFLGNNSSYFKRCKLLHCVPAEDLFDLHAGLAMFDSPSSKRSGTLSGFQPQNEDSQTSLPTTPVPKSKRRKVSQSQSQIGRQMSQNGLKFDDPAYERAAAFQDHIEKIVTSQRHSTMKPASVTKYREYYKIHKASNEFTFLWNIFPILIGDGYHVAVKEPAPEETPDHEAESHVFKQFLLDEGVTTAVSTDFKKIGFPGTFSDHPDLEDVVVKELAKDAGMTTPRPDFAFGTASYKLPLASGTILPQYIWDRLEIISDMRYPFLIIEGKAAAGDTCKAENQARRGAATLIMASRSLRREVGAQKATTSSEDTTAGNALQPNQYPPKSDEPIPANSKQPSPVMPDYDSFLFSVVLSPSSFDVYVHWFDESTKDYHMNFVDSISLRNSKGGPEIRKTLHNIMEWGASTRRAENEALHKMIEDYGARRMSAAQNSEKAAEQAVTKALTDMVEPGKSSTKPSKKRSRFGSNDDNE